MKEKSPAGLYIVATPIGNLADITFRAVETLKSVDWIAAEDTRHTQFLLQHYDIRTPQKSLHAHNEAGRVEWLLDVLKKGGSVALVSDAGTPLISDPGYSVVKAVRAAGFSVFTIPGACAAVAALSVSGLPTDAFRFIGFLASKGAARVNELKTLRAETATLIFYESPHRIVDLLAELKTVFGADRVVVIARELTKQFEQVVSGSVSELEVGLRSEKIPTRGEFVVLVQGGEQDRSEKISLTWESILSTLLAELPLKQAVSLTVSLSGVAKNVVYQQALMLQKKE